MHIRGQKSTINEWLYGMFLIVFLSHIYNSSFAQQNCPIWYFGQFAGLDFSTGSPVAITNGKINSSEGCAVASTCTGKLLFYTDGVTVWDKLHNVMPNGTGLLGHASSTQSSIVVAHPGNNNQYYIFTTGAWPAGDLRYSLVDLNLNAGNGDVVIAQKNQLLLVSSMEQLTATFHNNKCDQWIIAIEDITHNIYAYRLTPTGISPPIISNVGSTCTASSSGQIKMSPDGKLMAAANFGSGCKNELFNFNNTTGVFIKWMNLATQSYGIEFSADNTKLYSGWPLLEQYDLSSNVPATINASRITIGSKVALYSIQRGPDNKIYTANNNSTCLDFVDKPNLAGIAAGYVSCGVSLAGKRVLLGLPSCASKIKGNSVFFNVNDSSTCANTQVTFTPLIISTCDTTGQKYHWTFAGGSPASSDSIKPKVTFSGVGAHDVKLVVTTNCNKDSLTKTNYIKIISCGCLLTANATTTPAICGNTYGTASASQNGGSGSYSYLWNNGQTTQSATGLAPGNYTVTVTDAGSCTATTVVTMISPQPLLGQFAKGTAACSASGGCGCKEWIIVNASGGTSPYSYSWPDGYVNRYKNQLCPGNYTINIRDKNGCNINVNLSTP